jgi:DNA replicative helicase MCM subunit Mcm2 (Cdc46/Mcm family)
LCHRHVAAFDPLHETHPRKDALLVLGEHVDQNQPKIKSAIEISPKLAVPLFLVAEQELVTGFVQLQPVDLRVVSYLTYQHPGHQVHYADGLEVQQIGQFLVVDGLVAFVEAHADEVRVREFSPDRAEDVVVAVFDQSEFTRVENQTHCGVVEVEFLVSAGIVPWHLRE